MKKPIALLCGAVLAASVLASCANTDSTAPDGFKEISDDGVTYDLYVPLDWIKEPYLSEGLTAARYSDQDPANISVTAFELASDSLTAPTTTAAETDSDSDSDVADESARLAYAALESYWSGYEPTLKAVFTDLEYLEDTPRRVTLDGAAAMEYVYSGSMQMSAQGAEKYIFRQIVAIKDMRVYIFTYTASEATYAEHTEDVNAILEYFCFT